ncbi:uncharacterized protein PAC_19819 [Phialocephala subalpina]|uniref:Uncharacterized protein n=1 Tax=Phialocephala subalpina TaxID=576137 RepID=A0A1L7XY41_9HELO|nr:uncharacterized protein PAC_19819 [Phialocephala subalpina]
MSSFPYFGGPSEDIREYERRQAEELRCYRERDQRRKDAYESISNERSHGRARYTSPVDDLPDMFRHVRVSSPEPPRRSPRAYRTPSPPPPRRSSQVFRSPSPPRTFYKSSNADRSGPTSYYSTSEAYPAEFRTRRAQSPPRPAPRGPSPPPSSRYRSPSPPPRRAYPGFGRVSSPPHRPRSPPPRAYRPEPSRPASPPPRRAYFPPPRPRSPPRRFRSPSPPPPPRHSSPPQPKDENPHGIYTYDDEEPDTIPIAPAPWNNNSTSISRSSLLSFLVRKGVSKETAEREVDKEFAAHAPTRRGGAVEAGPSIAEMRAKAEARKERENRWGGGERREENEGW